MSKIPWELVNAGSNPGTIDVARLCVAAEDSSASPIDDFFDYRTQVIRLATEDSFATHQVLGHILVLGIVSAVELYFRSVLTRTCRICPISRENSSSLLVSLGAVDYYGKDDIALGVLERASLAGSKQIKDSTSKFTGITLNDGELAAAVDQFDKVCELRHAAVHSRGRLGAGNIRTLAVETAACRLSIDLKGFHEIVLVCDNLVRVYNRVVFAGLAGRLPSLIAKGMPVSQANRILVQLLRLYWSQDSAEGRRPLDLYRAVQCMMLRASVAQ